LMIIALVLQVSEITIKQTISGKDKIKKLLL